MASNYDIGTAYVKVMPNAQGIQGKIQQSLGGEMDKAGTEGGNRLVGAMKKVIAVAGIAKFVGSAISAGADLQQSLGGIETLYKDSADRMKEYASQAYMTAGVSANDYMQQVTSYSAGLIKSLGGDTAKATDVANMAMIDMADNANKMGTDIQSIQMAYQGFAKQNYTMLDNLKLGYGGTKSEMERLLKDAEKLTGIKYDINNLADVYSAIHVIQDELGITGTTALEAQETISGSLMMLKASYQDFLGNLTLGNDITPQLEAMMQSAVVVLKNLVPAIGNVIIGIPKVIIKNWPAITKAVKAMLAKLIVTWQMNRKEWLKQGSDMVVQVAKGLIDKIPAFLSALGKFISTFVSFVASNWPKIMATIASTLGQILAYILQRLPGIIKSIFWLAVNLIKVALLGLKTIITTPFITAWNYVKGLYAGVGAWFMGIVNTIRSAFAGVLNAITTPFRTAYNTVKGIVDKIKGLFPLSIGKIFSNIKIPKISVSGGKAPFGIGGKGSLPKFNIQWNAQGGIVDGATLIGAGERGAEAIVPLDPFWQRLDNQSRATEALLANILSVLDEMAVAVEQGKTITISGREFGRLVKAV